MPDGLTALSGEEIAQLRKMPRRTDINDYMREETMSDGERDLILSLADYRELTDFEWRRGVALWYRTEHADVLLATLDAANENARTTEKRAYQAGFDAGRGLKV